jgi:Glycosyltransferase 61
MKLLSIRAYPEPQTVLDDTLRGSFVACFKDAQVTGRNLHYPNCLIETSTGLWNPYDERVMSLKRDSFYDNDEWLEYAPSETTQVETTPCFFFVYNVDNYFHFVYDTLPILASYFKLKETIPELKLLLNTSHPSKTTFAPFVTEFLMALGIETFALVSKSTRYETLYGSTSFTHGQKSNEAPSAPAYSVWSRLSSPIQDTPKRFYISRRSWVHGKTKNMGTNYTMRRKCENEDAVVELLARYGIQEVFTELLTTEEKIAYFQNAELVVGIVGGGMCNLLFSPHTTKSLCIDTPYFLEINERFQHSMGHTQLLVSKCSSHVPSPGPFKLYSRVRVINAESQYVGCVGEVESYPDSEHVEVSLSSNDIAGFSQDFPLTRAVLSVLDLEAVDYGLNSPFVCDLELLEQNLKQVLNQE